METQGQTRAGRRGETKTRAIKPKNSLQHYLTFFLIFGLLALLGSYGLQQTALKADFTEKALTTSKNLPYVEGIIKERLTAQLGDLDSADQLADTVVTAENTKAMVAWGVNAAYTGDAAIDLDAITAKIKAAAGISDAAADSSITSQLLESVLNTIVSNVGSYVDKQVSAEFVKAHSAYQKISDSVQQVLKIAGIISLVLVFLLLLATRSIVNFISNLGWTGIWVGVLGTLGLYAGKFAAPILSNSGTIPDDLVVNYADSIVSALIPYLIVIGLSGLALAAITGIIRRIRR